MTFGKLFNERRKELGLTQLKMAEACGYTSVAAPQFISNIGRGLAHPPPESLKIICELFSWDYSIMADMICTEKSKTTREKYGLV